MARFALKRIASRQNSAPPANKLRQRLAFGGANMGGGFCAIITGLLLFSSSVFSQNLVAPLELEPESSLLAMFAEGCAEPIGANIDAGIREFPSQCLAAIADKDAAVSYIEDLPERLRAWGSDGLSGQAWRFMHDDCNAFFFDLMRAIPTVRSQITLSPHDLFHGHIVSYGEKRDHRERIAVIFHAKEYPSDLESTKNRYQLTREKFSSRDKGFRARNFLYLSDVGQKSFVVGRKLITLKNDIYAVKDTGACSRFFSGGVNTLSEKKIAQALKNGALQGDVNIFLPNNVGRIKYHFYSGVNMMSGRYVDDLEGYESGKSKIDRVLSNFVLDGLMASQQDPIIYLLTGR